MRWAILVQKVCWRSSQSPTGYATGAAFPLQVCALSKLFDTTRVIAGCSVPDNRPGEMYFTGKNITVAPLPSMPASVFWRRLALPLWLARNGLALTREVARADAVYAVIPGDIAVLGMILAFAMRKPLFVRHTNDWLEQRTLVGRLERWFLERIAGGQTVVLATGESEEPPSRRNPNIHWIFSTSLTERELRINAVQRTISSSKQFRIIIVARQEEAKGTDVLIRSLSLVRQVVPCVVLDVVGDGSAMPKFKKVADDLGLQNEITFHGHVQHQQVIELLRQADLLCLPTESESFGKAILEALSCGLPVVTTRLPVLVRLIGLRCGVLINERTPEALARAITWCLTDPNRYEKMSQAAIQTARSYSLERWCNTVHALLETAWGPLQGESTENDHLGPFEFIHADVETQDTGQFNAGSEGFLHGGRDPGPLSRESRRF
jgi:glycosyltransferase involved in cell wall biosynthesis